MKRIQKVLVKSNIDERIRFIGYVTLPLRGDTVKVRDYRYTHDSKIFGSTGEIPTSRILAYINECPMVED